MEISREDAKSSLEEIGVVQSQTRKLIESKYESSGLILWGVILLLGYMGTHFFLEWVWLIWMGLGSLGGGVMYLISRRQFRLSDPVKMPSGTKLGWRIFWFWITLYMYIFLWLMLLRPFNGIQMNAFMLTAIMYAYIIMGIWFGGGSMILCGLAVTCTTLIGYFLVPAQYYCLWMAPMTGGVLVSVGLYLRFRWG